MVNTAVNSGMSSVVNKKGIFVNKQQLAEACSAAMYQRDAAARAINITVDKIGPGSATLSMQVLDSMVNGHAICHGGYIFTLADTAFAYACNSHNANTVAAGARIEFLAPARLGEHLHAAATEVSLQGRNGVYDVVVCDDAGAKIALFRGNSKQIQGSVLDHD